MMAKKRPPENFKGSFSAIPHVVLDSIAFKGASDKAKALLFAIIRQLNGRNNGHIQLTSAWLKKQGYTSSNIYSARDELICRGIIEQTKFGGLNMGANLYAVTWLIISNFVELDIEESGFNRGAWARCTLPPTPRRSKPIKKNDRLHDKRSSTATATVVDDELPATLTVTKKAHLTDLPITTTVNNVVNTNTSLKNHRRIVGVKGKSGISSTSPTVTKESVAQ